MPRVDVVHFSELGGVAVRVQWSADSDRCLDAWFGRGSDGTRLAVNKAVSHRVGDMPRFMALGRITADGGG